MVYYTIYRNDKYFLLDENNVLHASGIRDDIERKLQFNANVKLLRNSKFKNLDSKYNPYTTGYIELDLAFYPVDRNGYGIVYTFVDVKTRKILCIPTKRKDSEQTIKCLDDAYKFYDRDIKVLSVDNGPEFNNNNVKKWCEDRRIALNIALTNRRFNGVAEGYIGFIKKYINEKLGLNQLAENGDWNKWREYLKIVVDELNKFNATQYPKPYKNQYESVINFDTDLKVGDEVHVKLDYPASVVDEKRVHGTFRYGDLHFTKRKYPITKIILRNNDQEPRYKINSYSKNTSFKRSEVLT